MPRFGAGGEGDRLPVRHESGNVAGWGTPRRGREEGDSLPFGATMEVFGAWMMRPALARSRCLSKKRVMKTPWMMLVLGATMSAALAVACSTAGPSEDTAPKTTLARGEVAPLVEGEDDGADDTCTKSSNYGPCNCCYHYTCERCEIVYRVGSPPETRCSSYETRTTCTCRCAEEF